MLKDMNSVWNDYVSSATADGKAQKLQSADTALHTPEKIRRHTRLGDYNYPEAFGAQSKKGDPFFRERMRRIMETTGAKTQMELAAILDIKQSSISDSYKRRRIPGDWYVKLMESKGLNPLYLKWNMEPIFIITENRSDMEPVSMPLHRTAFPLIKMLFRVVLPQPLAELALSKLYIDKERLSIQLPVFLAEFLPRDLATIVAANILDKLTE